MSAPCRVPIDQSHADLARLISIVAPGEFDLVSFWETYFDESGTHDNSEVMSVAGYIYQKDDCLNLDWQWKEVLDEYGLPYFRMVDCAHGAGPFKKLSRDDRIAVEIRMIELIKKYMTWGISVTIEEAKYNEWNSAGPSIFHSAYAWCCYMCVIGVATWANDKNLDGEISYFFEAGHQHQSDSNALMNSIFDIPAFRYQSHSFVRKPKVRPIQSADILAWQSAKFAKDKGKRRPRKDFVSLVAQDTVTLHGKKEMFDRVQAQMREYLEDPSRLSEDLGNWAREDAEKQPS